METTRTERQTMTPDEARSFDGFSIGNATMVATCLRADANPMRTFSPIAAGWLNASK